MSVDVPVARIRALNGHGVDAAGRFVLYWMIAARRLHWNFALQRAVNLALELRRPLLILEALDVDYPWASDRLHRFILDGMAVNARAASDGPAVYYPFVESGPGKKRGLIASLAASSSVVVTDDYPAFFLPRIVARAAALCRTRFEAVDTNGLVPIASHGRAFGSARAYRAFVQREIRSHLAECPEEDPLRRLPRAGRLMRLPAGLRTSWPPAADALLDRRATALARLPIDHRVPPAALEGGSRAGSQRLARFLTEGLPRYAGDHNHPDADCTSRLSPYLHFGHVSPHEVFAAVMTHERWTTRRLATRGGGRRDGWWGVSDGANAFLDQLVVWRELAFNGCAWVPDFTRYDSLPEWARQTLQAHAGDRRRRYEFATLDAASTDDELWNAAQRQLATEGWFHGYLRMLWGKKILEWAPDPQTALDWMESLMNRYSLDGRDPVSYASFTWVLGRYDRPWPRRPVFGTVRSMTSESAKRKLKMREFLATYGRAR